MSTPSLSVAVAALSMQFLLVVVLALASSVYRGPDFDVDLANAHSVNRLVLWLAVLSLLPLFLSSDLAEAGQTMFGGMRIPSLSTTNALTIALSVDVVLLSLLIANTAGVLSSPFAAALHSLPAFALFLRQPAERVLWFTAAIVLFTWANALGGKRTNAYNNTAAWQLVTISMLVIGTFLGIVTAPL